MHRCVQMQRSFSVFSKSLMAFRCVLVASSLCFVGGAAHLAAATMAEMTWCFVGLGWVCLPFVNIS